MKYLVYLISFAVITLLLFNVCSSVSKLQRSVQILDSRTKAVEKNVGVMKSTVEEVRKSYHIIREEFE